MAHSYLLAVQVSVLKPTTESSGQRQRALRGRCVTDHWSRDTRSRSTISAPMTALRNFLRSAEATRGCSFHALSAEAFVRLARPSQKAQPKTLLKEGEQVAAA